MGFITDQLRGRAGGAQGPLEAAERELAMFVESALLFRGEGPSAAEPGEGGFLFLIGAAEYICRHHALDDAAFHRLALAVLRATGLDDPAGEGFLSGLRHHLMLPDSREALREGGYSMREWLTGKDNNAPMRFAQVAREWHEAHGPR